MNLILITGMITAQKTINNVNYYQVFCKKIEKEIKVIDYKIEGDYLDKFVAIKGYLDLINDQLVIVAEKIKINE